MAKSPRRKRSPSVVITLGATGKLIRWNGETFDVSKGDDASITLAASNVSQICGIR